MLKEKIEAAGAARLLVLRGYTGRETILPVRVNRR